jgi:hypothetical protein
VLTSFGGSDPNLIDPVSWYRRVGPPDDARRSGGR